MAKVFTGVMLATFAMWGIAGFVAAGTTRHVVSGMTAGGWSAMICMLITVLVGFTLMCFGAPRSEYVSTWSEFQSSGWNDPRAFSIANTLEAGLTHLVPGPAIGLIVGAVGGCLSIVVGRASSGVSGLPH